MPVCDQGSLFLFTFPEDISEHMSKDIYWKAI